MENFTLENIRFRKKMPASKISCHVIILTQIFHHLYRTTFLKRLRKNARLLSNLPITEPQQDVRKISVM